MVTSWWLCYGSLTFQKSLIPLIFLVKKITFRYKFEWQAPRFLLKTCNSFIQIINASFLFPLIALANMVTLCETWNQPINHIYFVSIVFWTYLKYWIKETSYLFFYRKYSFYLLKKVLYWNSSDIQIAKAFATTQKFKGEAMLYKWAWTTCYNSDEGLKIKILCYPWYYY